MARETYEDWVVPEFAPDVIQALGRNSATEKLARPETMTSDTKQVPRSGDFAVAVIAKGAAYGETAGTNDYVEMIARKVGGIHRVAVEDLMDSRVDILATKRVDAARGLAKFFDNATLAVSAASNGGTIPYTSVYKAVRTTNSATSYTADDNYTAGALSYANLNSTLAKYEDSEWADDSETFVIAHPAFKAAMRGLLDSQNRPIFVQGQGDVADVLFGHPITWSFGAKVSATATQSPTGNPLLIVGNRQLMIKGMAQLAPYVTSTNPGFQLQLPTSGDGFKTDEALLKAAMRRGFVIGTEHGFSVFEKTS
ncbi:phage major capsid protein [Streptomyces sp. NPDC102365]|uniref:phage major capsid protein n=1 Tax=Streptomyces sp. NPDC102365 TaxID=3366162 RepID=UPI00380F30CE